MPAADVLSELPTLERAVALTRALAVLDAVMSEDWQFRYFSFDAAWGDGEQMASMRNGSGDDWFCWFGSPGGALVGFDHESSMSPYAREPQALWPGLTDDVPTAFLEPVLNEPAFSLSDTTFVLWRQLGDPAWQSSRVELPEEPDPDGARDLLELLIDDRPEAYEAFASEDYERTVSADAIAAIYRGAPLTRSLVTVLNRDRNVDEVLREAGRMGYPTT